METSSRYCEKGHMDQVKSFCKKCNKFVCETCVMKHHYDHLDEQTFLNDLYCESLIEYRKQLNQLKYHVKINEQHTTALSVDEIRHSIQNQIEIAYSSLIEEVLKHKERVLEKVFNSPYFDVLQKAKVDYPDSANYASGLISDLEEIISKVNDSIMNESYMDNYIYVDENYRRDYKSKTDLLLKRQKSVLQSGKETVVSNYIDIKLQLDKIDQLIDIHYPDSKIAQYSGVKKNLHFLPPSSNILHTYNPESQVTSSVQLSSNFLSRSVTSILEVGEKIYFIGGSEYCNFTGKNFEYSPSEHRIKEIAPLKNGRYGIGLASIKNAHIYAIGGGYPNVDICEKYDISGNTWTKMSNIIKEDSWIPVVTISERFLYCFGGQNHVHVQKYDTYFEGKGWSYIPVEVQDGFISGFGKSAVQINDNEIFLFGGSGTDLNSFIYDLKERNFQKKADLQKHVIQNCSIHPPGIYNGKVFGVGDSADLHIYSIKKDKWRVLSKNVWIK